MITIGWPSPFYSNNKFCNLCLCKGKIFRKSFNILCKKSNGPRHSMMKKIFVFKSISKNRISHCSATNGRQKTIFFENLFVIGFHLGTVENRKGHSEKLANSHW